MSLRRTSASVAALLLVSSFASGCRIALVAPPVPREAMPVAPTARQEANAKIYLEAWDIVRMNYFSRSVLKPNWVAIRDKHLPQAIGAEDTPQLYAAINAMIRELDDSHTAALAPKFAAVVKTGVAARCGFQLGKIEDRWVVRDVLEGGPAAQAGVQPGWIFLSENGVPAGQVAVFDRKVGQVVHDDFLDQADQKVGVDLQARVLPVVGPPRARVLEGGIVYLRFDEFKWPVSQWFSEQIRQHRDAPGIIVDLRNNRGGLLLSLEVILNNLFPKNVDMGLFDSDVGWRQAIGLYSMFEPHYTGKVAVLVSSASASSSEILASTVQQNHRGLIVGRKTAGAVRESWDFKLSDGGEVQVSISDYHTLDGRHLEGAGVIPDVTVETKLADLRAGRDPDLQAALVRLRPEPADRTP